MDGFNFDEEFDEVVPEEGSKEGTQPVMPDVVEEGETVVETKEVNTVVEKEANHEVAPAGMFDNLGGIDGLDVAVVGETGISSSIFPIERALFSSKNKQMISIITSKVIVVKTHYSQDVGKALCDKGACCKYMGLPSLRYVYPVVSYNCDKTGKPISKDIELKMIVLGKDAYESIKTIHDLNGNIADLDIVVTCTDDQYQKCIYTPAGPSRWKKDSSIVKEVTKLWERDKQYLLLPVGRVMTEEYIRSKLTESTGAQHEDSSPAHKNTEFASGSISWEE